MEIYLGVGREGGWLMIQKRLAHYSLVAGLLFPSGSATCKSTTSDHMRHGRERSFELRYGALALEEQ